MTEEYLLEIKDLKMYFPIEKGFFKVQDGFVKAVDGVSLAIKPGETVALVGESGSGKTTLGLCALRAQEPTAGEIIFNFGEQAIDITKLGRKELRAFRHQAQMVFQDPYSSLNPRMTVLDIISEPLVVNKMMKGKELREKVKYLMNIVGLDVRHLHRYPHAFSGGQRQRIGIARALATSPRLIIADEPTSALDVSVQAQILNLLQDLQQQSRLTYLFISHDLSVVRHVSDRVLIMYLGRLVESGPRRAIFAKPRHPYTEALLGSVPIPDPMIVSGLEPAPGEVGDPTNPPQGCHFHPRCKYAQRRCKEEVPQLKTVHSGHFSACHFSKELMLAGITG